MLENCNVVKELQAGMKIAFNSTDGLLQIAEVGTIPPNPNINSVINCILFKQERAPHKPKWLRSFSKTEKFNSVRYSDIILYDFELTKNGALKKKSRDYFKDNSYII